MLIAIALLIVAAALPVHRACREKVRHGQCLSNLKRLSLCTITYAVEWDERFPARPSVLISHSLEDGKGLAPDLARYLPPDDWRRRIHYINDNVFFCPTTRSLYSYEFNANLYGVQWRSIAEPSYTPLEYDAGFATGAPPAPHREAPYDGYNTSYVDGHVFWMPGAYRHGAWESLTMTGR